MFQRWVRLRTRLFFGFTALYLAPCSPKAEHQDTFLQEVLCELKQYAISAINGHGQESVCFTSTDRVQE